MNTTLYVQEPAGPDWSYSLDPTIPKANFQLSRSFSVDATGKPFVDGTGYMVYAYHTPSDHLAQELVTFRAGPETTLLVDDLELQDLDATLRRGRTSTLTPVVGGVQSRSWPAVTTSDRIVVLRKNTDGTDDLAALPISLLQAGGGGGGPVTEVPTLEWGYGPIWELVDAPVEQLLEWGYGPIWILVDAITEVVPAPPTRVRVIRQPGTRNATLSWVDQSGNETAFEVEESSDDVIYKPLQKLEKNVTVLPLNGLPMLEARYYRVRSANGAGSSDWVKSNKLVLRDYTAVFGVYGPGASTDRIRQLLGGSISVSPVTGNIGVVITLPGGSAPTAEDYEQISFELLDPAGAAQGYNYPAGGPQAAPYFAYAASGRELAAGRYDALVTLYKFGQPIQVIPLSWSFSDPIVKPAKPIAFSAARNANQTGVELRWTRNSTNEDSFEFEFKRPNETSFRHLTEVLTGSSSLGELISPLPDNTLFRIRSKNSAGPSDWLETTLIGPPPTPGTLFVTSVKGGVGLFWGISGSNTDSLVAWSGATDIERAGPDGVFGSVFRVATGNTYNDTSAVVGTIYSYRVRHVNVTTGQTSAYLTIASVKRFS